ncbi:hypothetical protein ONN26_24725, partial [Salmonella enterica subsp. enterica serovar Muenster]|nr:hypothetical protein [Salmonella enterica subsp. enterica serovar Muenster]
PETPYSPPLMMQWHSERLGNSRRVWILTTGDEAPEERPLAILMKMQDPQFAGQTKERLSSRQCAAFVSGVVKDAFSLWLNQNVQA